MAHGGRGARLLLRHTPRPFCDARPATHTRPCLCSHALVLTHVSGRNELVHLDIKPDNIFTKEGDFKLGDFGLVNQVTDSEVEEGDSR